MLVPYQTKMFDSALSHTQVLERLGAAVEPRRRIRTREAKRLFEGVVEGNAFKIQRTIIYRNDFLPRLHGTVEAAPSGRARIRVQFRLKPAVAIAMVFWFGSLGLAGAMTLRTAPTDLQRLLFIGGMFGLGVVLVSVGFVAEASRTSRLLADILVARERPPVRSSV